MIAPFLSAVLAACGGAPATPTPTPAAGEISHPTGAHEVVLRMESGGGLVPSSFFATHVPQFTLYGDGTVIFRPSVDMLDPGRPDLARLVVGRLDEEGVQALLGFALGAGRLRDARDHYGDVPCADCGATTFTLDAAGLSKTVTAEALGMVDETGHDAIDRRGMALLAETLAGFDERARRGELGDAALHDPSHYRVFLLEALGEPAEVVDWPWADVTPDEFAARTDDWRRQAVLDRTHVAALTDVPSGGQMLVYVRDDDGGLWEMAMRPLLPDELAAEGLPVE